MITSNEGGPSLSHHFDSAADRADGRINACDRYAFPAAPGGTALIVTVNPDAGRSSPTTFRPDALHEFVVANNGGTSEDIAFSVTFTEPDQTGQQQSQVRRASGPAASRGTAGTLLGEGRTGTVFSLDLDGDGLAWAGWPPTPSNGDGIALGKFLQALSQGRYTPEVFTVPSNTFAGRDVTCGVRKGVHAARRYSCRRPPSRSRRWTRAGCSSPTTASRGPGAGA